MVMPFKLLSRFCPRSVTAGHWIPALWSGWIATTIALGVVIATPAMAQEQFRTLTVTGQGSETIQTTIALVRLGVEVEGVTAQVVQQSVAQRSNAVVSLLKSRDVAKLETTGVNLNPNYRYVNNQRQLKGYRGSNIVSFQIATDKVGPLLDEAVQAGATRIDGVSFKASDATIAQAQQAALRSATEDAQAQANAVLSALNFAPQGIVSIQVNGAQVPPPFPASRSLAAVEADASPRSPVIGGEQTVRASVTLQIRY